MRGFLKAVSAGGLALLALWLRGAGRKMRVPGDNPRAFARRGRPAGTQLVVVCAGDSLTHGEASANYLELLRGRFAGQGYAFVNAGINGNLAYNVLRRLDTIIACKPDVVTILVGTNDVNATLNEQNARRYRSQQGLPEPPTLEWYRQNVTRIVERLRAETDARLTLLSLPMLGEDLDSPANERVRTYNAALREIAAAQRVAYLPLGETLAAALPAGHRPPPYDGTLKLALGALLRRFALRQSWAAISAAHGLALLTDHIHLNERGAAIVADLIADFLEGDGR